MIINDFFYNENIFAKKNIAILVNTEGINNLGLPMLVLKEYWPELINIGPCSLGSVLIKQTDEFNIYGIVCYSKNHYWCNNQYELVKNCFDSIPTDEPIDVIFMGLIDTLGASANCNRILAALMNSEKSIRIY